MRTIEKADVELLLPYARQALKTNQSLLGQSLLASADDCSIGGLASAHINWEQIVPGWCKCIPDKWQEDSTNGQVYFRNKDTGSHGWICERCHKITQTG